MHSSDETGDEPGRVVPASGTTAEPETAKLPAHAFRERIRRASVTAAQTGEALATATAPLPESPPSRSSLPPEHSGVRNRPDEPKAPLITPAPVFLSSTSRRPTPRAWPFNQGNRGDAKRGLATSQVGVAAPSAVSSVGAQQAAQAADPAALEFATTEVATRSEQAVERAEPSSDVHSAPVPRAEGAVTSDAEPSHPGAYSVTPPEELSTESSSSSWSPVKTKPQRPLLRQGDLTNAAGRYSVRDSAAEYVTPPPETETTAAEAIAHAPTERHSEDDDPNARARRYTPKQRPAQRRGRLHDRASVVRSAMEERAELARTLPDIRTTAPSRPHALQQAALIPIADTPTQPKGRPHAARSPSSEPPPLREASIVVDPAASSGAGAIGAIGATPSSLTPTVIPRPRRPSPAPYVPLPADKESFEAFMREQAKQRGGAGARLNWNQQETLLIPRDSLGPEPLDVLKTRPLPWVVAIAAVLVSLGLLIVLFRGNDARSVRVVQLASSTAASASSSTRTLIATEPSGAELMQGGAVLGNTPMEVPRPVQGDVTFVVRMAGFESAMVRVTPQSSAAIHVTLMPNSAAPQP